MGVKVFIMVRCAEIALVRSGSHSSESWLYCDHLECDKVGASDDL